MVDTHSSLQVLSMTQTTVIITVDGYDPEYIDACDAPNLMELARKGFYRVGKSMMPSVTNVNNVSIVTGEYPSAHGISSNYRMVRETGQDIYMESGEYILSETFFQRAKKMGARTILSTSKDKLRTLLSDGADVAISSEQAPAWAVEGVGEPPPIYSLDVNGWTIRAASHAMSLEPADIVYISTTDFAMHTYAPDEPESQQHISVLDDAIGELVQAHPDVTLLLTADHGMNPKRRMVDLADVLAVNGIGAEAVPIIKDRYVVHHNNLGGCMFMYLHSGDESRTEEGGTGAARDRWRGARVQSSGGCGRAQAELRPQSATWWSPATSTRCSARRSSRTRGTTPGLGHSLRSHASAHEQDVPIIGYNGDFDGFEFSENRDIGRYVFERVLR